MRFLAALFAACLLAWGPLAPLPAQGQPPETPWLTAAMKAHLSHPETLVLGWSKAGTVALLAVEDGGGRGQAVRLVVFDTVDDRLLLDTEVWTDEVGAGSDQPEAQAFQMAMSEPGLAFVETCYDAGVEPLAVPARLAAFPLVRAGVPFKAQALVRRSGTPDEENGTQPLDYSLVVSSPQGRKTIASGHEERAYGVSVEGWALSPKEPRALVVFGISRPGFEGERPVEYRFSGCLLSSGFKP